MSALKEWLNNPSDVSYTGIYDNHEDLHQYQFMVGQEQLQSMIDIAKNKGKQVNPMVWMVCTSKKHHHITIRYQSTERFTTLQI